VSTRAGRTILTVGDVHYDMRQLDWLLARASDHELVVLVGDLLDVSSTVPLAAQIPVVLRYLEKLAERTRVAVCSGNHDLTERDADGEQAAPWLAEAAGSGVVVDNGALVLGDDLVSVYPWWDGPIGRARLEVALEEQAARAAAVPGRWIWVYHWPPPDLAVSWIGTKTYGDADLAGWLEQYRPDLVLTGHVHQSPWVDGGSWIAPTGPTWVLNAGRQTGPEPSHTIVDLDAWTATWWSYEGEEQRSLSAPEPVIA
jgi:Icc-related predicted phosphoesterase